MGPQGLQVQPVLLVRRGLEAGPQEQLDPPGLLDHREKMEPQVLSVLLDQLDRQAQQEPTGRRVSMARQERQGRLARLVQLVQQALRVPLDLLEMMARRVLMARLARLERLVLPDLSASQERPDPQVQTGTMEPTATLDPQDRRE